MDKYHVIYGKFSKSREKIRRQSMSRAAIRLLRDAPPPLEKPLYTEFHFPSEACDNFHCMLLRNIH